MNLTNRVQLIGNVGQDPEIGDLDNGKKYAKFSIATSEKFINAKGEKVERTYWHNITFWNKTAELVGRYVKKGDKLGLEGKLITRSWKDESGERHYRTEVVGRELLLF